MGRNIVITFFALAHIAQGQTVQTTFEFHSSFWVNLHHTLYNQATGKKAGRIPNLTALNAEEAAAWNAALEYYERNFADLQLLDGAMTRINGELVRAPHADSLEGTELRPPLLPILEKAAPVYRAHWWAEHDRKNREWIDQVTPSIAEHEKDLRPALAHAYHTAWPKGRIRVEMSYYTPGVSAYTLLRPTLITISSWSQRNAPPAGLETIFHEAGHALIDKVTKEIGATEKRRGRKAPYPDLWHAVIFYTTGELVHRDVPELTPYAVKYGMWDNNWPDLLPILEKEWKPFLDGEGNFKDAVDRFATDAINGRSDERHSPAPSRK